MAVLLAMLLTVAAPHPFQVSTELGTRRTSATSSLPEPAGVILLYRLSAPRGADVRGFVQLPHVTVPLRIETARPAASGSCRAHGARVVCTVGEEWCPMPEGTWRVHIVKRSGPPGRVMLTFRVGPPPA